MSRLGLLALGLLFFLSACGAPATPEAPAMPFIVTLQPEAQPSVEPLNTPEPLATEPLVPEVLATAPQTEPPLATATQPAPSETPQPTLTPYVATPTETLLPALDLPTERVNAPALVGWTGQPTYPGDSDPGRLFRVDYDPDLWAQTEGNFGDIVLGNRQIEYCTITPWSGRGLPGDWKVEHEFRYIGSAAFDVNTVSYQETVKFVSYVGGDQRVLTGFQVLFKDQREKCLEQAEAIFGTLRSFSALPTITPTP